MIVVLESLVLKRGKELRDYLRVGEKFFFLVKVILKCVYIENELEKKEQVKVQKRVRRVDRIIFWGKLGGQNENVQVKNVVGVEWCEYYIFIFLKLEGGR